MRKYSGGGAKKGVAHRACSTKWRPTAEVGQLSGEHELRVTFTVL